ncbi:MAG: hypothetical protein HY217_13085 [Candidatus Rokubacteria bacterium]|nr:hypothetical protein [Candidatus Rokubacteria bacterium]
MARRAGSPPVFRSTRAWRRCGSGSRAARPFGYGADYQSVGKRLETLATSAMKKDRKVWAALDPTRRPSKRQKDLADIARLLETYPGLREHIPTEVLDRLV